MVTWIMIAYLSASNFGGASVVTTFHSQKSCEDAALKLKNAHLFIVNFAMCFEDQQEAR